MYTVSEVTEDKRGTKKIEHTRLARTEDGILDYVCAYRSGYQTKGVTYPTIYEALQQGLNLSLAMGIGGSPFLILFHDSGEEAIEDGYGEDAIPGLSEAWRAGSL